MKPCAEKLIRQGDALQVMLEDLRMQGRTVRFYDADQRTGWFAAAVQLLAELPSVYQRSAWAYLLASSLPLFAQSISEVTAELYLAAEEVKPCPE